MNARFHLRFTPWRVFAPGALSRVMTARRISFRTAKVMKRSITLLCIWCSLGLGYLGSADVRASLWASAMVTAMPDTWVGRLLPTGSMEPTLNENDWLIFQRTPFGRIRPGDVISFHCPLDSVPVTHRVVRRLENGRLLTRGDNNLEVDPWTVGAEDFRGLLIAVYLDK